MNQKFLAHVNNVEVHIQETLDNRYGVYLFVGSSLMMSLYGSHDEMMIKYNSIVKGLEYEESLIVE